MESSNAQAVAVARVTLADRIANLVATFLPLGMLGLAAWQTWGGALHVRDLAILAFCYTLTGLGITVGFHRLFTHRSFRTVPALRALLGVLGSAAVEGPLIEWVANHRKHHRFSDVEGDPHSPHVGHRGGVRGALAGLYHAHIGWILRGDALPDERRYAPDLLRDPLARFVDRWFVAWVAGGLAVPFALGLALSGGSLAGGLEGLLWGGAVRIFLLHHATFAINSLCHYFGRRGFRTEDESRNLAWLALPTFGEAWHNNHHAFPTSARHGLRWWQLDPSAWLIAALERAGLAWEVVRVSPLRQREHRARALAAEARRSPLGAPRRSS